MTIDKYPITITDVQKVRLPINSEILTAQMQRGVLCLWALVKEVNKEFLEVDRTIEIFGTGPLINNTPRKYLGTVQTLDGLLVWHVFERLQ